MISELMQGMNWQWWIAQVFATISIIFCVSAMQQKNTTDILWDMTIYSLLVFGGGCFLGKLPVVIMTGVAFLRNFILYLLSHRTESSKTFNRLIYTALAFILIIFNVIFCEGYLSMLSITVGLAFLTAFIQEKPANVRRITIIASFIAIIFYLLSFAPVNAFINFAILISSVIGQFRFNKLKGKNSLIRISH